MSSGSAARLAAVYGACFAVLGVSIPFFPVWLDQRGLGASAMGVLLAISILVRALFAPLLMALADQGFGVRRLLVLSNIGGALAYAALSATSDALAIGLLVAVLAVAQSAVVPLSDFAIIDLVPRNPRLDYGRIRLWGSIAFLAANIGSGYIIGAAGAGIIVWLLAALSLSGVAVVWIGPPPEPGSESVDVSQSASEAPNLKSMPTALWCVLAAAAFIQASHAALYGFASIDWRARGFSETAIGFLWAAGVVAEIVLFALLGPMMDVARGAFRCLMLGGAAAIFRFAVMTFEPGLPATFALQILHGLSFGATHLGTMAALALIAPPALRGRTQGLLSSALAVAMAGASVMSGAVFRTAGPLAFAAMVPLAGLGLAFAAMAARRAAFHPQRTGEGGWTTPPS
jgi:PPP family 3-phenylpropionic acid transporter